MLFVDIHVSTWFTLFVSALTILHSIFLNDGKVVFSLFKILFKFLRINFCSCVSVSFRLFCCVAFGWVGFPFSEGGGSFWMDCFCLLIFDAPSNVVFLLSWSFIFWCISIIIIIIASFSYQRELMIFQWSLNDSKSPRVYRTHFSIKAELNNVVVLMVLICPPIFFLLQLPLQAFGCSSERANYNCY